MSPPTGDRILSGQNVLLRLPSGVHKIVRVSADTTISLGKFGTFPSNALLHRPYNLTYDILDNNAGLRVVPAAEVTRDILGGGLRQEQEQGVADETHYDLSYVSPASGSATPTTPAGAVATPTEEVMRTNRLTVDTPDSQTLSWEEIEELKKTAGNSGKDLIQKLLAGHSAIGQKTPFSLQKYTLRKASKFLRRFSVHRLTVSSLTDYLPMQKEPYRFLDMRNHHLGLMLSLGNVVYGGRYLVVDETGGLLVAAVAERLGILNAPPSSTLAAAASDAEGEAEPTEPEQKKRKLDVPPPVRNTITLVHANEQPNLSLLTNFDYDANSPPATHPLYTHLKTLSWLQLLDPENDTSLLKPPTSTPEELAALKSGKRSAYYRKLRRWQKVSSAVADAREGNFDAVLVAAHISTPGVLKAVVPLVKGSGQVVVYSPSLEQATELADLYSSARRTTWIQRKNDETATPPATTTTTTATAEDVAANWDDEIPDPTLVLAPTVHRLNMRQYQVLPGRTHPVMTSRGGAEGYVFHGTRVLPVAGKVDARGAYASQKKKRRVEEEGEGEKEETSMKVE
ncbi:Gcd10p family-domain-containing protein [Tricharina praecox]|uniref:Gcd10p family-domain-containing protein n=1 Tax=Tricharina praecox TaxID=43433 RepID=UPI00221F8B80|nr:Gcd10p family-domain-containing protein [Tricharina praecox]KAI5852174.1 Gcd10p family-domain-containing protein [Tricharina praecox]